jgi:hypothetical protein
MAAWIWAGPVEPSGDGVAETEIWELDDKREANMGGGVDGPAEETAEDDESECVGDGVRDGERRTSSAKCTRRVVRVVIGEEW